MILTTTNSIEGFKIVEYKGIVTGVGLNAKRLGSGFSTKKYYAALEKSVNEVKEQAFQQLQENAHGLKANAVVGIKVEIELTASNYAIVSATGTAVKVAEFS